MFNDAIKTTALFAAVVFLIALDRLFKAFAMSFMPEIKLAGEWFKIVLAKNQGIAFSLPFSGLCLNIALVMIIIVMIYIFIINFKKAAYFKAVLLSAIILGAASNFYDRLRFGYVIDYFSLKHYSVFNIADTLILFGLLGLLWLAIDKNRL